ncbi:MAG TPA: 3-phosphoserine/phosphohydroxythreonine transaminase, partial [Pirellulales bacterium]|nr:3-phosphoserine/phosphohydroxythreonine transaminase [Pirellulales bacterium]
KGADYIVTGTWGQMAMIEAKREGTVRAAYNSKSTNFDRLPQAGELEIDSQAAFAHFTSNETIQGVEFLDEPAVGDVPLVCDASSDFLSRPLPIDKYGLIYACAQKNAGPSGVTAVIIRDDLLARSSDDLPSMLNYRLYADEKSMPNTPPVFAVYIMWLVTRWLEKSVGGLKKMHALNQAKAKLLYDVIDRSSGFYRGHAQPSCRSLMNVTFRFHDEPTQNAFLKEAEARGLHSLKGHRSVGGIRASIYNAMPREGVEALRDFMLEFQKQHAS